MTKAFLHIKRFFILIGLQVIVLNNVQISGYLNPYIYILFIMLLPPKMPKALVLSLAFLTGFTVDVFENSYGIRAAASVFMAYVRPTVLSLVSVKGGEDLETIGIRQLRFARFFTYSGILCILHHFTLFYIEAFRLNEFIDTFVRALTSTVISLLIILLIESVRSNSHK